MEESDGCQKMDKCVCLSVPEGQPPPPFMDTSPSTKVHFGPRWRYTSGWTIEESVLMDVKALKCSSGKCSCYPTAALLLLGSAREVPVTCATDLLWWRPQRTPAAASHGREVCIWYTAGTVQLILPPVGCWFRAHVCRQLWTTSRGSDHTNWQQKVRVICPEACWGAWSVCRVSQHHFGGLYLVQEAKLLFSWLCCLYRTVPKRPLNLSSLTQIIGLLWKDPGAAICVHIWSLLSGADTGCVTWYGFHMFIPADKSQVAAITLSGCLSRSNISGMLFYTIEDVDDWENQLK